MRKQLTITVLFRIFRYIKKEVMMKVKDLILSLELIADQVDMVGHDMQIHMISDLSNKLKGRPITTDSGDWNADEIVSELDRISIKEIRVGLELRTMASILKGWS